LEKGLPTGAAEQRACRFARAIAARNAPESPAGLAFIGRLAATRGSPPGRTQDNLVDDRKAQRRRTGRIAGNTVPASPG
jgi:hypothetical protein